MIDFEWYRSFMAVYRLGTVTGAAAERNLTQPAVTQHIAALEAAVGAALFTRAPRRMLPTERGKTLYNQIAQSLETLEQVSQTQRRPAQAALPLVRLGTPREYFVEVALPRIAGAALRLAVQFGTARPLLEALQRGESDLVIATERITLRGVEYRKLAEEAFVLVGGGATCAPLASDVNTLERWISAQDWLSYASDLPIIRRFWRQSLRRRPAILPKLIIPDLHTLALAVAQGQGVSVLPRYLCAAAITAGRLRVLWEPPEPVTNDIWLAYRAAERGRPEIVLAQNMLRSVE